MRVKRVFLVLSIAVLALALTAPADAQLAGKKYEIDFFGIHMNSPFDLIFSGLECAEFVNAHTVCFPNAFNACGRYTVDNVVGGTIYFTVDIRPNVSPVFKGRITLHGSVDRTGPGSSMGFSFYGRMFSSLFAIPLTGVNGSGHGVQDCTVVGPQPGRPSDRWVMND